MEKSEFAVNVLKQYALENQVIARSTSDLSPLEQWLILQLFAKGKISFGCDIVGGADSCESFNEPNEKHCIGCNHLVRKVSI